MANEIDKLTEELLKEAGVDELVCKPNPLTGELVCSITEEQEKALEKAGFEPKLVVYEVRQKTR